MSKSDIIRSLDLDAAQVEVLDLIMEGYSNSEIAQQTKCSEAWVKRIAASLFKAAGVETRIRLMASLWHQGWGFRAPVVRDGLLPKGRV